MYGDKMIVKKSSKKHSEGPTIDVTPLMAAFFLGYMKSENGDKISDENIKDLYEGACYSMGISPVEDISEFFNELFSPKKKIEVDLENSYYN